MTFPRKSRGFCHLGALQLGLLLLVTLGAALAAAESPRGYAVILNDESVGRRVSQNLRNQKGRVKTTSPDYQALTRRVLAAQEPVKTAISATGATVTTSVCHTVNAVFIQATRMQAEQIRQLGEVKKVVRTPRFTKLLNEADDLIRAPQAWNAVGGINQAGAGIRIGIIDSGIDIEHPGMIDQSLVPPPGFPKGRPEDLVFTNNKVIVARSYVSLLSPSDPAFSRPDDLSPRDRVGHGTSVAMIAAGRQVSSPVGTLTGIAPKAFLGNYKIFGSPDINEFSSAEAVIAAIDDAVIDGMDVISISFGAVAQFPFDEQGNACSDDPRILCDPVAIAAQSAVEDFRVMVVAAAGNAGAFGEQHFPALNSIATPGSAPAVLTVGASANSRQFIQTIRFAGQSHTALSGTGPDLSSPFTAFATDAAAFGDGTGCTPYPANAMRGQVALVERGFCEFEFKIAFAAEAGAKAIVVTNAEGEDEPFVMFGLEATDIPAYMIGAVAGADLRDRLANGDVQVILDPTLVPRAIAPDQVAPFSSRGPSPSNDIKPEVVAPGNFIYSAAQRFDRNGDTFDQSGFTSVDGTSFSAPMVAGAAALVMQRHPEFSVAEIKSAIVNTAATQIFENGELARVTSVGAGIINVEAAIDPIATAIPSTISFGALTDAKVALDQLLTIRNTDAATHTYQAIVERRDEDPNTDLLVEGSEIVEFDLEGGELIDLRLSLDGARPAPGSYEGILRVVRLSGGIDLFIPYYYVVADGVPFNSFVISGTGVVGTANEPHPELLIFKVIDVHGQPVPNLGVSFSVVDGDGAIFVADNSTDLFGIAAADVDMGPNLGPQDYEASAGGLRVPFYSAARAKPFIQDVVNAGDPGGGRPISAGSIVSIYGENLSEFLGSNANLPLPIALKHASVSFDFPEAGVSVPGRFYFVSDKQANLQIPWEFAGLNFVFVKMRIEDSASEPFMVDLSDYSPGVFEFDYEGPLQGVITHLDGSPVTPSNPARPGETVVVYGTGMGPVTDPQVSGEATPFGSLIWTRQMPTVQVNGQDAVVLFSGLTPGFVGLYQLNITLPANLPSGNLLLVVFSNGVESNTVLIPIQQ
jgi:minor extracellular serine protease Vpr